MEQTLQERLRAIGEEEMHQSPASTKATIGEAAEALDTKDAAIAALNRALGTLGHGF